MRTTSTHRPAERGSVLVVSLMLLLVLTVLGITAMANMTMEERMAAGYQKLQQAIDGGSSATNRLLATSMDNFRIDGGVNNPLRAGMDGGLQIGIANAQDRGTVNLDSTTSSALRVAYLGDATGLRQMPGEDAAVGMVFDIRADTAVQVGGVTSAQSIQVQTVRWVVPGAMSGNYVEGSYSAESAEHLPFKDN